MAQSHIQTFHTHPCADDAIVEDLMKKVERGGQGVNGSVRAVKSYATKLQQCDGCGESIKLGELVVFVIITE